MAPVTRASKPKLTPEPAPTPSKTDAPSPEKADIPLQSIEGHRDGAQKRSQKRKARSRAYRKKKQQQALAAFHEMVSNPEQPLAGKAQLAAIRAAIYNPRAARSGSLRKTKTLEKLVLAQKGEIEELKKQVGRAAEQGQDQSQARDTRPKAEGGAGGRGTRRARRGVA